MTTGGRGLSARLHPRRRYRPQIDVRIADADDVVAEFGDQQLGSVLIDAVAHRRGHAHLEQRLDQVAALFGHAVGEFLDGDRLGHLDVADLLDLRLARAAHAAMFLLAGALERCERTRTRAIIVAKRTVDRELARLAAIVAGTASAAAAGARAARAAWARRCPATCAAAGAAAGDAGAAAARAPGAALAWAGAWEFRGAQPA